MIKTSNIVKRPLDLVDNFITRSRPRLDVQAGLGIETSAKKLDKLPRNIDVMAQGLAK